METFDEMLSEFQALLDSLTRFFVGYEETRKPYLEPPVNQE